MSDKLIDDLEHAMDEPDDLHLTRRAFKRLGMLLDGPVRRQATILRFVVDSVSDAIIVHDFSGKIFFYNEGACTLLGRTREQMAELPPFGWIAPEAMAGSAGRLETIRSEGVLTFSSSLLRADGAMIPTDVSARRVDSDGDSVIVSVIRDVTERVATQRKLEDLAYRDGLTGLSNRTAFEERLRQGIAEARRHGDLLGLGYIDLDQFKPVNDRYGHEAGDAVLIEVGNRLVASLREQDVVARLGGDEFVIMLQRMNSADEFAEIGDRILDAIRRPIAACGVDCKIDATIGFATFDPAVDDARSLVVKADTAMYAGKRDPAHAWKVWDESMGMTPPQ